MTNLYVTFHALQDVPPSNLNRDDTGSPKSARYGGVDRLRVSSQSIKRAMRLAFRDHVDQSELGLRTRRVAETLRNALRPIGMSEEQAEASAIALLAPLKITAGKKDQQTSYLLFVSRPQLAEVARQVADLEDLWDQPDELAKRVDVKAILGKGHSLDVALFGRMVADLADLNVDAAVQVAHPLGTHAAPTQFDYFTAVDDAQTDDETGAGMIGTIEYNSATIYRYAALSVRELISNMDDEVKALDGVEAFLKAFALALPSGKQNSFAAHSRPAVLLVEVRTDQPVSYMSAFEKPVQAQDNGYLVGSAAALAAFVDDEADRWGDAPSVQLISYAGNLAEILDPVFGASLGFDDLGRQLRSAVESGLSDD